MYDLALKFNPDHEDTYFNKGKRFNLFLGVSLEKLGEINEAISMYDLALQINPKNANVYYNKGTKYKFFRGFVK